VFLLLHELIKSPIANMTITILFITTSISNYKEQQPYKQNAKRGDKCQATVSIPDRLPSTKALFQGWE
jgi:hypothetical protein